jgi:hypothetical protein
MRTHQGTTATKILCGITISAHSEGRAALLEMDVSAGKVGRIGLLVRLLCNRSSGNLY